MSDDFYIPVEGYCPQLDTGFDYDNTLKLSGTTEFLCPACNSTHPVTLLKEFKFNIPKTSRNTFCKYLGVARQSVSNIESVSNAVSRLLEDNVVSIEIDLLQQKKVLADVFTGQKLYTDIVIGTSKSVAYMFGFYVQIPNTKYGITGVLDLMYNSIKKSNILVAVGDIEPIENSNLYIDETYGTKRFEIKIVIATKVTFLHDKN